jgi:hypothetical protein
MSIRLIKGKALCRRFAPAAGLLHQRPDPLWRARRDVRVWLVVGASA